MTLSGADGWTITVADDGDYESEPMPVQPATNVTLVVKPDREVWVSRYVLRFGELAWRDGELPGAERFPVVGGTYTLYVPINAFRLALGTWIDTGVIPVPRGLQP